MVLVKFTEYKKLYYFFLINQEDLNCPYCCIPKKPISIKRVINLRYKIFRAHVMDNQLPWSQEKCIQIISPTQKGEIILTTFCCVKRFIKFVYS